jgi:hypothetical protein
LYQLVPMLSILHTLVWHSPLFPSPVIPELKIKDNYWMMMSFLLLLTWRFLKHWEVLNPEFQSLWNLHTTDISSAQTFASNCKKSLMLNSHDTPAKRLHKSLMLNPNDSALVLEQILRWFFNPFDTETETHEDHVWQRNFSKGFFQNLTVLAMTPPQPSSNARFMTV